MRRKEKEITDRRAIDSIIKRSTVCRLAMSENGQPYITPMNFGYDGRNLYFHGARAGRKIDILKKNNRVCFEFDVDCRIVRSKTACKWSAGYQSVVGFGRASFVEDIEPKKAALDIIMRQYSDESFEYLKKSLDKITIIKVEIENITGKSSGQAQI